MANFVVGSCHTNNCFQICVNIIIISSQNPGVSEENEKNAPISSAKGYSR